MRELKEETGYVGTVIKDGEEGGRLGKGVMFNGWFSPNFALFFSSSQRMHVGARLVHY